MPLRVLSLAVLALLFAAPGALAAPDGFSSDDPPAALVASIDAAIAAEVGGAPEGRYASLGQAVAAALTEDEKLAAGDADDSDHFGYSVSLDGDRALVGASGDACAAGTA